MNYKRNLQYVYMLPDEPVDLREAEEKCQAKGWELASFNQDNTSLDVDFITAQNFIKDELPGRLYDYWHLYSNEKVCYNKETGQREIDLSPRPCAMHITRPIVFHPFKGNRLLNRDLREKGNFIFHDPHALFCEYNKHGEFGTDKNSGDSTVVIVLGAVFAVVVVLMAVALCFVWKKYKNEQTKNAAHANSSA